MNTDPALALANQSLADQAISDEVLTDRTVADEVLAEEGLRWQRHIGPLATLRDRLLAEFERNCAAGTAELLAWLPSRHGDYQLVLEPGRSLPVLRDPEAAPVLDFADEAAEAEEFLIGDVALSQDGRTLVYTVDLTGDDRYELRLVELGRPGRRLRTGVGSAVGWHDATGTVLFTELEELRPAAVCRADLAGRTLGVLARAEPDEYLDLDLAADGRTLLIGRQGHHRRSVLLVDPVTAEVVPGWESDPDERVQLDLNAGHSWLLRTRPDQPDELLVGLGRPTGGRDYWRRRCMASPDIHWDEVIAGSGFALLVARQGGGQQLCRVAADRLGRPEPVPLTGTGPDELASIAVLAATEIVRDSWDAPARRYRIAPDGRRGHPVGAAPAPPGAAGIEVVRLRAVSADGTGIPLTLLWPRGRRRPGPTVLYGYGAYGVALDPGYSPFRISLLERGIAFAIAHVRGGGELGPAWHRAGRGVAKYHAVADYLACAQHLVTAGWTAPDGLVARSRSAGAAIVGAAINAEPELFTAAVLEVPFVDCLRTLSDPDAELTSVEWQEWGNPLDDPIARDRLAALSPLDNVRPAAYPALLVTGGLSDSRVSVAEPLRYGRAVRAATSSGRPVLVKVDDGGHLGHSDVDQDWQDEADVLAFVLDQLDQLDRSGGVE
ncbi:MAG TPA: prolyl oligopeptidase family serine peptidase [Jatrophihabitans sp.]|nr:prolyl oligopeptidase family serine peptidase [Jatrophihabitans sp.]